jgi:hypothetical protein
MTKNHELPTGALFAGRWVGETQGREMPAHIWEIIPHGAYLKVRNCWEGEERFRTLDAVAISGEPAFEIYGKFKATLVDKQHFVIPNWCDGPGGEGPYDVVFSRPGLAELTAGEAYQKFLRANKDAADRGSPASRTVSPNGN